MEGYISNGSGQHLLDVAEVVGPMSNLLDSSSPTATGAVDG